MQMLLKDSAEAKVPTIPPATVKRQVDTMPITYIMSVKPLRSHQMCRPWRWRGKFQPMASAAGQGALRRSGAAKQRGRPPGATAEDTVSRLVEAAQTHYGMYGYAGARMTEIAAAAGITHSSIYQYFASKRDLYQAAFSAALAELLPEYSIAAKTETTLKGRLTAIVRASARVNERDPKITPFLASVPIELRRHPELITPLQELGDDVMAPLSQIFAEARKNGEIASAISDRDLMVSFIGAAMGIGLLSYALPDGDMNAAVEVFIAGIEGTLFSN